jgi:hypothetical protein
MQCAACHHSFDASDDASVPAICPECGSQVGPAVAVATAEPMAVEPITFEQAEPVAVDAPAKTPKGKRGARQAINDMLVSLIFVGAVVVAVASTLVAMRAMKERDEFKSQAEKTELALGKVIDAAANSSRLKGTANAKAREEIFGPAIAYYQQSAWDLRQNPDNLDRAALAYQRAAGLEAKSGKGGLAEDLQSVAEVFEQMTKADYDPARYPSLYNNALKNTTPLEWGLVTDTPRDVHAVKLLMAFSACVPALEALAIKHPETAVFRDDQAGLLRISGTLQTLVPERRAFAGDAWKSARDLLEGLVREQPTNVDYQVRLVEALTALSNIQRQENKDEAIANLKRAVEVREQMAQANPEDKDLASELAKAKSALAKLAG